MPNPNHNMSTALPQQKTDTETEQTITLQYTEICFNIFAICGNNIYSDDCVVEILVQIADIKYIDYSSFKYP